MICTVASSACTTSSPKDIAWQETSEALVWPEPPLEERIRYLRSITGAGDFKKEDRGAKAWRWLFGDDSVDIPLITPYSVVYTPDGIVWVADSGSKMLVRIDLSREEVEYFQELNEQELVLPVGLAFDPTKKVIYLSDAILNTVFAVSVDGETVALSPPDGGFKRPAGMVVDSSGRLFVADVLDGSVLVFSNDGKFQRRIFSALAPDGRFGRPVDVAIGPAGEVVVLDASLFHLEVQSSDGSLLRTIGQVGDAPGYFARPKGVAVNSHGHVFVTDAAFDNIQVFDMAGRLLLHFGGAGSSAGKFSLPAGLFVDTKGRIFAADSYNSRIQVFQGP